MYNNINDKKSKNRIYRFIYDQKCAVTKQDIYKALGLSMPTIHQKISELIEERLVKPGKILESSGGRPPIAYIVESKIKFAVGISLSANHIRMLASDILQNEIAYKRIKITSLNIDDIGKRIYYELGIFLEENKLEMKNFIGAGIAIPGVIDFDNDVLILSPTLKMKGLKIDELRKNIPLKTIVENDGTCGGLCEYLALPHNERDKNLAYILLENGVGGALFIGGKLYTGSNGRSAEFGHMCVEPGGRMCNCGMRGCLEAYMSALRFSRDEGVQIEDFFEKLEKGNKRYNEIWDDGIKHLAIAVNNIRMAFDCDIVIGGVISEYIELHMDRLRDEVEKLNPFEDGTEYLRTAKLPRRASMAGAAWYVIEEYISKI